MFSSPIGVFFSFIYSHNTFSMQTLGFRPLSGYSSHLSQIIELMGDKDTFSSPVGVFFLFIDWDAGNKSFKRVFIPCRGFLLIYTRSRNYMYLLQSFHPLSGFSSYLYTERKDGQLSYNEFSSPVGVFFLFI